MLRFIAGPRDSTDLRIRNGRGLAMSTAQEILERARQLPESLQAEVLDFIDYLSQKARKENEEWTSLSLAAALRGMEHDEWPELDLTERWR